MGTIAVAALLAAAPARGEDAHRMPANRDKVAQSLIQRGVIARDATPEQLEEAVSAYLQSKAGGEKSGNRLARKLLDANEELLNTQAEQATIRGRKLGAATHVDASTPQFKQLGDYGFAQGEDKLLLVLVDFSDTPYTWTPDGAEGPRTASGPLHNQIPAPGNDYDLWRPDFTTQHYEDMLFTPGGWTVPWGMYAGEKRASMRDYYLAQSFGKYAVGGNAYGWYTVDKPEAYYGDDDAEGNDLLPGTTWDLIRDAVGVVNSSATPIPWADYDLNGDCVLDHVLFIHAGVDQSAGGGAEGDDAIWAHSWDVQPAVQVAPPAGNCTEGFFISNYTIMPEDGGIGVFTHEYGHDLGLPDEYDTAYTGRGESVANWSLMSNGSWVGVPAQTEPSNMSIWARYALGWLVPGDNLAVVSHASLTSDPVAFRLEQSGFWGGPGTLNALRINIPPSVTVFTRPYAGARSAWGGKSDLRDAVLSRQVDLTGKASATLSFWTWYDIEAGWDFGFVQVSTDGGTTWTSLPIAGTTSTHDPAAMPEIVAQLPGFTGSSGGWVQKTADLSAYAGQQITLAFRYMTDWGTTNGGWFVDEVSVVADGASLFTYGAESDDAAWTLSGWTRSDGSLTFSRYYMAEWRNLTPFTVPHPDAPILNFDAGLRHSTQFDSYGSTGNPGNPWLYSYNPGLLLWLRDTAYAENWTRAHLGHGFLLVVDAHDQTIWRPSAGSLARGYGSIPFNTHVQISDATFSLDRSLDFTLGYWGVTRDYSGLNGVPVFDDGLRYWSRQSPDASTFVPDFGLLVRVAGEAADDSAALIGIGRSK